jgi:hypothetical protein
MTRVGPPPHAAWVGGNFISLVVRAAAAVRIHRCYDCRADQSGVCRVPKKVPCLAAVLAAAAWLFIALNYLIWRWSWWSNA